MQEIKNKIKSSKNDERCVFCDILKGKLSANFILKRKDLAVFESIAPKAPIHYLIVPNKHIPTLNKAKAIDRSILGNMALAAIEAAKKLGLRGGYKIAVNVDKMGGQSVFHLHMHLIGGWSEKQRKIIERIA